MFDFLRKKMTIEEYGYMCVDTLFPELVEQPSISVNEWAGAGLDSEEVAKRLAALCLAFHQFCHIGLLTDDANQRLLAGGMRRVEERFRGFSTDPVTIEVVCDYMRTAASDLKNKSKKEGFPTLVPKAVSRVTGLSQQDQHWYAASDMVYSILEVILKTSHQSFEKLGGTAKLV